ncbi:MAG: LytTR family DNA-binding domain-containing protein [Eubacteriales bacterium]
MLRIAYCDDMEKDRERIMISLGQIEDKWGEEFELSSFSSGESLCEDITKNHYDIILLDILMNGLDGIETATRIRTTGEENLIIFISSYDDRIKELFDFRTIAFIDKPLETSKLEEALSKAYSILQKDNEVFFTYGSRGSTGHIPMKDIVYFESKRNEVIITTVKGQECYYGTLLSVWQNVENLNQFIMPHRSFVFNLHHVSIKSDKVIIKKTGETFNIGEKYRKDTRNRHMNFIEKRWR